MNQDMRVYDYLNGHLTDSDRNAFEHDLISDPSLAERVEAERALMEKVRTEFQAWDSPALHSSVADNILSQLAAEPTSPPRFRGFLAPLLIAAALVAGFFWFSQKSVPDHPEPSQVRMVMASNHPLINIYVIDPLPANLWEGDVTP